MVEFMDEDELIAEFHRAGIWLPGEREAWERHVLPIPREFFEQMRRAQPLSNQQAALCAQQQQRIHGHRAGIGSTVAGSLGGALGGLFR